jgi:CubicO group peptidase (beta-lactamase class C family)
MSHRHVETLLGRLATDPALRRRFAANREALLEEFRSHGHELTAIELRALASTEPDAIDRFARSLDERLRKAEFTNEHDPSTQEAVMSSVSPIESVSEVQVNGVCPDRFERVREAFVGNFITRGDLGASAAVYLHGEPVVDIWAGHFDAARTRPWESDTIVNTFSTTKTMTALCMLILADRGELDLDAPVSRYWPEFAQNGKSGVLVKHFLSHAAGLPGWDEPLTLEQQCDVPYATKLLEKQAPWWKPGTAIGYHPISFGHLNGEVVRRITGQSLGAFFRSEVAGPLGGDYHIGTGPECDRRVTAMVQTMTPRMPQNNGSIHDRAFFNPYIMPQDSAKLCWRRAELGGSSGHGNARSVAAIQSVLSNGGEARGVRLLSRTGAERAMELQAIGVDLVCGYELHWALGFALASPIVDQIYGGRLYGRRIAFWGGSGGSICFNDFDLGMTVAYVMNKHEEHGGVDQRGADIIMAAYDSVSEG